MKNRLLSLFIIFSTLSCGSIKIHDAEVCTVAGTLSAGANCTKAVSGKKKEITFEQLIDMLEPVNGHGPAVIISLNDYIEIKKQIESACVYLRCTKEEKKSIKKIIKNLTDLLTEGR